MNDNPEVKEVREALEHMMTRKMGDEEIQKSLQDFDRRFLFIVPDISTSFAIELVEREITRFDHWFTGTDGSYKPHITVTASSDTFLGIRRKEINVFSAFASGDLKVKGPFRDLLKFKKLLK